MLTLGNSKVEKRFTGGITATNRHHDVGGRLRWLLSQRRVDTGAGVGVAAVGGIGIVVVTVLLDAIATSFEAPIVGAGSIVRTIELAVDAALGRNAGVGGAVVVVVAVFVHLLTGARKTIADVDCALVSVLAVAVLGAAVPFFLRNTLASLTVVISVGTPVIRPGFAVVADLLDELAAAGFVVAGVGGARIIVFADDWRERTTLGLVAGVGGAGVLVVALDDDADALGGVALVAAGARVAVVATHGVDTVSAHSVDAEIVSAQVVVLADLGRALAGAGVASVVVGAGVVVGARTTRGHVDALCAVAADVGRADVVVVAVHVLGALRFGGVRRRNFLHVWLGVRRCRVGTGISGVYGRNVRTLVCLSVDTRVGRVGVLERIAANAGQYQRHRAKRGFQIEDLRHGLLGASMPRTKLHRH